MIKWKPQKRECPRCKRTKRITLGQNECALCRAFLRWVTDRKWRQIQRGFNALLGRDMRELPHD